MEMSVLNVSIGSMYCYTNAQHDNVEIDERE